MEKIKSEIIEVKEKLLIVDKKIKKYQQRQGELDEKMNNIEITITHFRSKNDSKSVDEQVKLLNSTANELIFCLTILNLILKSKKFLQSKSHILVEEKRKSMSSRTFI